MTNPIYLRDGLHFNAHKTMEECGELIQAICKALAYGWESTNPELPYGHPDKITNKGWVLKEIKDVQHLCKRLEDTIGNELHD